MSKNKADKSKGKVQAAPEQKTHNKRGGQPDNLRKSQKVLFARFPWCGIYKEMTKVNAYNAANPAKPLPEITGGQA